MAISDPGYGVNRISGAKEGRSVVYDVGAGSTQVLQLGPAGLLGRWLYITATGGNVGYFFHDSMTEPSLAARDTLAVDGTITARDPQTCGELIDGESRRVFAVETQPIFTVRNDTGGTVVLRVEDSQV